MSQQHAYTSIQMHETIGRQAGLSGTDHKYLGFLIQKGQMTAGELSVLTGLTTGAVTGLIDRLAKKKLVKRQASKEDRRKTVIVPDTDKMIALLQPFYEDYQDSSDKLLGSFSKKELETLDKYFTKTLEIMNAKIGRLKTNRKNTL